MKTTKERSKNYRDRIKSDPEKYEKYKEKERERYKRRIEEGKIKTAKSKMSKVEREELRAYWKEKSRSYRKKSRDTRKTKAKPVKPVSRQKKKDGGEKADLEMKAKWTSLRDTFRREFQRNQAGCKKKIKWTSYDQMMFSEPSILYQARKKEKLVVSKEYDEEILNSELIIKSEDDSPVEESREVETSQPDEAEIDAPNNSMERESISKENGYEDDYHFAMSLVPAMKRVPNDRKLRMRLKILQILSEEGGANDSSV